MARPRSCTCGVCAKCRHADYMRAWWARKMPEQRRAYVARRDPAKVAEQDRRKMRKRWHEREDFRAKQAARAAVARAVRRGDLVRGPCEVGGDCAGRIEGHHDDHARPLDVRWLCAKHHREHHAAEAVPA